MGDLRIISGTLKGRKVKTIDLPGTRPMTDRVRENLFNILAPSLKAHENQPAINFLDLFAGSGAIGIEAISRGATSATFVESDRQWTKVIDDNLQKFSLKELCECLLGDAYRIVKNLSNTSKKFDIIFAGPPYDHDHHNRIIKSVTETDICKINGLIVLQYRKTDPLLLPDGYSARIKTYGITSLAFIRRQND